MLVLAALLLAGLYVGWNIGANDAGNCIGTAVGSQILSYRRAILIVSVFAVLGAVLQGRGVIDTIGKGIVAGEISIAGILISLLSAGAVVTAATVLGLPVSTGEAVVGAVVGVGLASGLAIDGAILLNIGAVWLVCPFLTALLSYLLFRSLGAIFQRIRRLAMADAVLKVLLILSSAYVAFSMGASNAGKAVGPIANAGIDPGWLSLLGGLALAFGILTYGRRVTETIGSGIVQLAPLTAFCAQTAAALAIHSFSILGIPVSTSQAVVGAIVGVGLVKGVQAVRGRRLVGIGAGWVATPTAAGVFSYLVYRLVGALGWV